MLMEIGPSKVRATSGENLGRPLLLVINLLSPVTKTPKWIVVKKFGDPRTITYFGGSLKIIVGFQNFAWAPN